MDCRTLCRTLPKILLAYLQQVMSGTQLLMQSQEITPAADEPVE